jgi:hypothetical protein
MIRSFILFAPKFGRFANFRKLPVANYTQILAKNSNKICSTAVNPKRYTAPNSKFQDCASVGGGGH